MKNYVKEEKLNPSQSIQLSRQALPIYYDQSNFWQY